MPAFDRLACLRTLECAPTATPVEIYRSYRILRKKYHPDTLTTGNADLFVKVTDAYETLKENFIIDMSTIKKEDTDAEDYYSAPDSLKTERQRQKDLKEKLDVTPTEEDLQRKIVEVLVGKLETQKNISCSVVLQPMFVMSLLIVMEDVYAKMIVDVRRSEGGDYSGKLQFSTNKKSVNPESPFVKLDQELLDRLLNTVALLDFEIQYTDSDTTLYAQELQGLWPTERLFEANKNLSCADMYSAILMHGKSKYARVSEFRNIIERHIEAVVLKGDLSYSSSAVALKFFSEQGKELYYPYYVRVNLGRIASVQYSEEYLLLPDGNVFILKSPYFTAKCFQVISNTRIKELIIRYYEDAKREHEGKLELQLTEQLKEENKVLMKQLQARKDLENILGNLKRDLIE